MTCHNSSIQTSITKSRKKKERQAFGRGSHRQPLTFDPRESTPTSFESRNVNSYVNKRQPRFWLFMAKFNQKFKEKVTIESTVKQEAAEAKEKTTFTTELELN